MKNKIAALFVIMMVLSGAAVLSVQKSVFGENLPIVVNLSHMAFGDVFPGQVVEKDFAVSYAGAGEGRYTITEKYKPRTDAKVPEGYEGGISTYCQEHHDDSQRCYRNLCPYITVESKEKEGDTVDNAVVSKTDLTDIWTVRLETPAIFGKVRQGYDGAIVTETGEYGCDLAFNVATPSQPICGNGKVEEGEECDDNNKTDGDECSSTCKVNKGTIAGCQYNDRNGNGMIESGEEKMGGWEIQLVRCPYSPMEAGSRILNDKENIGKGLPGACSVSATTVTGADGCYKFTGLGAGDYGVNETGKSGWTQKVPETGKYYYLHVGKGQDVKDIDFLNYQETPAPVCGNGAKEAGEDCDDRNRKDGDGCSKDCKIEACADTVSGAKNGVPTKAVMSSGENVTAKVAKADGSFATQNVSTGKTEYITLEWNNLAIPAGTNLTSAALTIKHMETGIDVYLEGWNGSNWVSVASVDEKESNHESSFNVASVIAQSGTSNIKLRLKLTNPTKCHESLDYAYLALNYGSITKRACQGEISGCKYSDKNNSGQIDKCDEKVSGWQFALLKCENGHCTLKRTTMTGNDGCYKFDSVEPGVYEVAEYNRNGWTQVFPKQGQGYINIKLSGEEKIGGKDFLNHKENTIACGNGIKETGEQCDDGNSNNWDGCSSTCQKEVPVCGNGHTEGDEQCDDGNNIAWDGCNAVCKTEKLFCGNGHLDAGEDCDDGNFINWDGCTTDCRKEYPVCGNGHLDYGEDCDDGNKVDWDGCSNVCKKQAQVCGNGIVEGSESCDDGNVNNWDGCSAKCLKEIPVCGNGHTEGSEQCDDGNTTGGDGCSSSCTTESHGCSGCNVCRKPTIKDQKVFDITETSAKFAWYTNITADSRVVCGSKSVPGAKTKGKPDYGYDFSTQTYDLTTKVNDHNLTVFDLKPNTKYYCRVISSNRCGEIISDELSFTTPEHKIIEPPTEIRKLYIYGLTLLSQSTTCVDLQWKTNIKGTTCVVYGGSTRSLGAKPEYGYEWHTSECWNLSKQTTAHTTKVCGLNPCTTYHFRLTSTDGSLDAVTEEQQVRTMCQKTTPYYPRVYKPSVTTTKVEEPKVETGQVAAATVEKCPTCEVCPAAQETIKTVIEKERYMTCEDWLILFFILVILALLLNALLSRSRRNREDRSLGTSSGGILGKSPKSYSEQAEEIVAPENKLD